MNVKYDSNNRIALIQQLKLPQMLNVSLNETRHVENLYFQNTSLTIVCLDVIFSSVFYRLNAPGRWGLLVNMVPDMVHL